MPAAARTANEERGEETIRAPNTWLPHSPGGEKSGAVCAGKECGQSRRRVSLVNAFLGVAAAQRLRGWLFCCDGVHDDRLGVAGSSM